MKHFHRTAVVLSVLVLLASCSTFPTKQLSFDVSQDKVPVMLTDVAGGSKTKEFTFDAGYESETVTSQNKYSQGTTTVSLSQDTSKPLAVQLDNFFIQDPEWIYVKNLSISDDHTVFNFAFVGIDRADYTTSLQLDAPVAEATK